MQEGMRAGVWQEGLVLAQQQVGERRNAILGLTPPVT